MARIFTVVALLLLLVLVAGEVLAGGEVYVYDRDAQSRKELRQSARALGLKVGELVQLNPSRYVNLGVDPTGAEKVAAIVVLPPGGIIYWTQTNLTNQCTNFTKFAAMAVAGCQLRSALVDRVVRDARGRGFVVICSDRTEVEVRSCD